MTRPLRQNSIFDLTAMAERNWDNKAELELIRSELGYRSTAAAQKLRERLAIWINDCNRFAVNGTQANSNEEAPLTTSQSMSFDPKTAQWTYDAVAKLRARLIDLSRKSPLIALKHTSRSASQLRFVDERPDLLFGRLNTGSMGFEPLPGEEQTPVDEQTPEFGISYERARLTDVEFLAATEKLGDAESDVRAWQDAERALRSRVRAELGLPKIDFGKGLDVAALAKAHGFDPSYDLKFSDDDGVKAHHEDDDIRVLLVRKELDRRLKSIADRATSHLRETGHHTLHLAFGFVQWFEDDTSDIASHAPLLLLPVTLEKDEKRARKNYRLVRWEGDLDVNVALIEKAREHWGLEIPALRDEDTPESYFIRAKAVLAQGRRLTLRTFITLSVMPPMILWRDLDPEKWPENAFAEHRLLPGLVGATEIGGVDGDDTLIDIDDPVNVARVPALITDADASQHRAIMDMAAGRDMAIEGPPGTGKSQTITNMIATALSQGKRVLFVAEKQAALRVVSDRLRVAGFGPLLLELHGDRASRADVYSGVRERLDARTPHNLETLKQKRDELSRHRNLLRRYLSLVRMPLGKLGQTAHALAWREIRLRESFTRDEFSAIESRWSPADPSELDRATLTENRELLAQFGAALCAIDSSIDGKRTLWAKANKLDPFDQRKALEIAAQARRAAEAVLIADTLLASLGIQLPGPDGEIDSASEQLSKVAPLTCRDEQIVACALHNRELSLELIAAQSRWQSQRDSLADTIENPDVVAVESAEALRDAIGLVCCPASIAVAETQLNLNEELLKRLAGANRDVDRIVSRLASGAQTSVSRAKIVASAIAELGQAKPAVASLMSIDLIDIASDSAIVSSSAQAQTLSTEKGELAARLQSEAFTAEPTELEEIAETIESTGAVARLFSGSYKTAWRRSVRLLADNADRQTASTTLRRTAAFLRAQRTFAEASKARELFPILLWDGIKSDFTSLQAARSLAAGVSSHLATEDETAILRWWLAADTSERQNLSAACERLNILFADLSEAGYLDTSLEVLPVSCETRSNALEALIEAGKAVSLQREASFHGENGSIADSLLKLHEARRQFDELRIQGNLRWVDDVHFTLSSLNQTLVELDETFAIAGPADLQAVLSKSKTPAEHLVAISSNAEELADAVRLWGVASDKLQQVSELSLPELCQGYDWDEAVKCLATMSEDELGASLAADLLKYRNSVASRQLSAFSELAVAGGAPADRLDDLYELAATSALLRSYLGADGQDLGRLGSLALDAARQSFKRIDKELHKLEASEIVARRLLDKAPAGVGHGRRSDFTELRLLENEIGLTRPRTPLRDVAHRAGAALQALKPVWMMSPTSIAQFIRPGSLKFHLLIVDEASQMRPEFSVSCILRGDQFVVVGDANQLPPSDHFQVASVDAEDNDDDVGVDAGTESILDLANQRFRTKPRLKWHYRSQHESLIQFSNREFYDRDLVVFPSPTAGDDDLLGVKCIYAPSIHSDTIYDSSINQREAELIIEHAFGLMQTHPERSIGIVAMNSKQTELIQNEFDRLIVEEETVRKYVESFEGTIDEFFIKNLENVQGDERDIILISTVYGPGKDGNVRQNFGLMNREVGWRRLNVLVTRAKMSCRLITSLRPDDVKVTENSSRGILAFKSYLTYAHSGAHYNDASGGETDSDFEIFVADALRGAEYEVIYQVGVENFRIDLGVRHESCPVGFIAGIECDGAPYHTGLSVRDRDHIRQTVLENLGWNIYRVWSTDWFNDPARETAKLLTWLEHTRQRIAAQLAEHSLTAEVRKPKPKTTTPAAVPIEVPLVSDEANGQATLLGTPAPEQTEVVRGLREPQGRELRSLGDFRTYEAIRGKLYEIWSEDVFQGEVEVVKRATSAPRLFGDRVMTAQSEYEGRVETTGDAFRSFDLYAAMREVASRANAGTDE